MSHANRSSRSKKEAASSATHQHSFDLGVLFPGSEVVSAPMQTFVECPSVDRRRLHWELVEVEPPSPVKCARMEAANSASTAPPISAPSTADPFSEPWEMDRYTMMEDDDPPLPDLPPFPESRAFKPADPAMDRWLRTLRDAYLRAMLRRDGRGDADCSVCPGYCRPGSVLTYRCGECTGEQLFCDSCCVKKHLENPLHIIYRWSGVFFTKTSLKTLGLSVQLGHPPGQRCTNPQAGNQAFVVIHDNSIHEVAVDFCGCDREKADLPYIQLLRAGWYPSTEHRPQTAAMFAKTTAYDFYSVLERMTDNTGVKPPNRYQIFLRMARQYRHLLMLKRAGQGHDLSGVFGTRSGELAVECPVCLHPGVNLPDGWENAPPEDRFIYVLFLALDACFRLKRRMISNEIKDPGLGTGWAYVMENALYWHFLHTVKDQKEMSTCSGLAALDYANTKFLCGYSTMGVGMGVCARHEFVQPNGVGDLQKGERFTNMDYIFALILRHKDPRLRKIISYDIVCQWWLHLLERLKKLPPLVRITIILEMFRFVIPKMHIHAHTLKCQILFSLNLIPGSGQTDSEGIERPWASIGAIATSTRVSGPGARHDALDDHWNFWNWLKTIGLPILRRRLDAARREQAVQREAFEVFSLEQADRVPEWRKMVEDFEADGQKKNLYEMKVSGLTEIEIRLRFATEEAAEAEKGVPPLHEVTPSAFITAGLELEEQQRRVRVQAELKKAKTMAMQISMKGLRSSLNRGIDRFRKLQATYTPGAIQALSKCVAPAGELVEDVRLILLSAMLEAERGGGGNSMWEAQCRMALVRLRSQLHIKSRFLIYKKTAWEARRKLANGDEGMVGWPRLKKEDIWCMQDAEELSRTAEKRRKASLRRARKEEELLPIAEEEEGEEMVTRGTS
ncbi:hypothetical protein B0H11DRAFT_2251870 [Mycena galericulata]|nr:hypothetical protein B0H11DRAFT_2251870 [Mycena galericulata]